METIAPSLIWLIVGAVFLALEAFGLPGLGLVFAGIGAIVTGIVIESGGVEASDIVLQGAVFCAGTVISALLLWKKLKQWRLNPKQPEYSNIVGEMAVVAGAGLTRGERGQVRWSGTVMQAEIDGDAEAIEAGAQVKITALHGSVLKVKKI